MLHLCPLVITILLIVGVIWVPPDCFTSGSVECYVGVVHHVGLPELIVATSSFCVILWRLVVNLFAGLEIAELTSPPPWSQRSSGGSSRLCGSWRGGVSPLGGLVAGVGHRLRQGELGDLGTQNGVVRQGEEGDLGTQNGAVRQGEDGDLGTQNGVARQGEDGERDGASFLLSYTAEDGKIKVLISLGNFLVPSKSKGSFSRPVSRDASPVRPVAESWTISPRRRYTPPSVAAWVEQRPPAGNTMYYSPSPAPRTTLRRSSQVSGA
uniref:(California timema) hypothetical protein n=1 Tax=Timema californicum TaxID=61474 RepID=A0A7R9J331_TIMCA|nr:unnamed protein product [Timema californicum]